MDKVIQSMLVNQVAVELGNSNQYLTLATKFKAMGLVNTADYFDKQSDEEHEHAEKFIAFLSKRGVDFALPAVAASQNESEFESDDKNIIQAWAETYVQLEVETSSLIDKLMEEAIRAHDNYAQDFLQDFVREQLNEVYEANQFLAVVSTTGSAALADLSVKNLR